MSGAVTMARWVGSEAKDQEGLWVAVRAVSYRWGRNVIRQEKGVKGQSE